MKWLLWMPLAFVAMLVLLWFAYPWLNPDAVDAEDDSAFVHAGAETEETILLDGQAVDERDRTFTKAEQIERELRFLGQIDSLKRQNQELSEQIRQLESELAAEAEEERSDTVAMEASHEAFQERIKSLLNLDERQMGPILERLSRDQLIRIYNEAGNMQREKILRALSTDRSVELISEVM